MARLGAEVEMLDVWGMIAMEKNCLKILEKKGVGTRHIKVLKEVPTGIALITVGKMTIRSSLCRKGLTDR